MTPRNVVLTSGRSRHRSSSRVSASSQSNFERQLHDIESGTAALNLNPAVVHLASEIAYFAPDMDDELRIALILLIVVSLAATEEGSTRFPVTGPESVEPMRRLLRPLCGASFGSDGVETMRTAIERMVTSSVANSVVGTDPNDYKPLIYLSPFIYQHRILISEVEVAARLTNLMNAQSGSMGKVPIGDSWTTQSSSSAENYSLSDEQRAAVELAATAPLAIISGGPGSGKTSIVLSILKLLIEGGSDPGLIALAAPTGKAAFRMSESLRADLPRDSEIATPGKNYPVPTTVHRMLGYSPDRKRFRYHRGNPLSAEVVIIDEGSMLDLELMSQVLEALRPGARLVVLGDADQLPSVSAGAVFRDLIPAPDASDSALVKSCIRLTRSYRVDVEGSAGRAVFSLAKAINSGDLKSVTDRENGTLTRRDSVQQIGFEGAEWLDEDSMSAAFAERWYEEQICGGRAGEDFADRVFVAGDSGFSPSECEALRSVFDRVSKSRMLCLTRVFDSGSERLNWMMHRRVAHARGLSPERERFIAGEPVMMLRNDYDRMLFNGDQGVVLRVRRGEDGPALMAVFVRGDNFYPLPIDSLREHLELCYATTVHKAQGSECDSVAVVLPEKDLPILSREILYTAVSRARKSVVIIGSKDILEAGLSRKIERYSGLREHLEQSFRESHSE